MRISHFFPLFLFFFLLSCSDERESVQPKRTDIVESVYSSVVLEAEGAYKVISSVPGYIRQLFVQEGDLLKSNQIICSLNDDPLKINEQNAALNVDLVQLNLTGEANMLEEMRLEWQTAKQKLSNDSLNYKRFKQLFDKGAISRSELERAELAYESSKTAVGSLQKRFTRKQKELKNQLSQAGNNQRIGALKTADYTIRTIMDGKVFQLLKEPGEFVNMQEPIAIVGKGDRFVIRMLVDEVDIARIALGQKVLVTLEAYRDQVFEAKLTFIAPKMDEKTQTFEVRGEFVQSPSRLYMGLTGEGNIIVNEKRSALVIPKGYLLPGNFVETDKGKIKVKTGLTNWDYVEVLSGITEQTTIYKPK